MDSLYIIGFLTGASGVSWYDLFAAQFPSQWKKLSVIIYSHGEIDPNILGRICINRTIGMYVAKCEFCDWIGESDNGDKLKEHGRNHILDEHYDEIEQKFDRDYTGGCQGGCGHRFSYDVSERDGFECPNCGHDHSKWFPSNRFFFAIEEQ